MSYNSGRRSTPPETPDEWKQFWENMAFLDAARPILAPFVAVVTNWKAILTVAAIVVALQSPRIISALEALSGTGQ